VILASLLVNMPLHVHYSLEVIVGRRTFLILLQNLIYRLENLEVIRLMYRNVYCLLMLMMVVLLMLLLLLRWYLMEYYLSFQLILQVY